MKAKSTLYLDVDLQAAVREYARTRHIGVGEATDRLLRRALYGAIEEGAEGLLVPEIRRAAAAGARAALEDVIIKALEKQSNRLAGLLVKSGRDAGTAVELSRDILEELYGNRELADNRQRDARLKAGSGYTSHELRKEMVSNGG